ncbi:MAG: SpoIIE family protein phosphatase [Treponema sp.]|nr:SpoIIE family protein phosphatase [Treponema sp.]
MELSIAAEIQASMLPYKFPAFPHRTEFEIYATMLPAKEIGGDFYDFFLIDDENLAIVIADISGKGIPAAMYMSITKTLIKNNARSGKSPGEVFETVNNTLCENNDTGMFVTAFMAYYNTISGTLLFSNAGHNPPFLKKKGKSYEIIKIDPCLVLGCMEDIAYNEEVINLESGDAIYLYTDGITEAMNKSRELFTTERLHKTLCKLNEHKPKDLINEVKHEIDRFVDGEEQADDITMLSLAINHFTEPKPKEIILEAGVEYLGEVLSFIGTELKRHNCPLVLQNNINLAVEEVFINIVNYAYPESKGKAKISIFIEEDAVIRFEDSGLPYNPIEQEEPDLNISPEDREIGGFGVFLVKQLMDKVEYERVDDKNILIITKKIKNLQ